MSPKTKTDTKATERARKSGEQDERVISRVAERLEAAQADLKLISGSLGSGVRDLRRDLSKLLSDARRDVRKMGKATRRDLQKLQSDLSSPRSARSKSTSAKTPKRTSRSH